MAIKDLINVIKHEYLHIWQLDESISHVQLSQGKAI